jgi:hypothetical protein
MQIKIEIVQPPGTDRDEIAEFVINAISNWGGQFHPDDPLFGSLRNRIKKVVVGHKRYQELEDAQ